jgi:hypothetical protein
VLEARLINSSAVSLALFELLVTLLQLVPAPQEGWPVDVPHNFWKFENINSSLKAYVSKVAYFITGLGSMVYRLKRQAPARTSLFLHLLRL